MSCSQCGTFHASSFKALDFENLKSYWEQPKGLILRCSDMYVKAAHTMGFYSKTGPNLLDVFMTNYPSIYHESVISCCFYVVYDIKTQFYV